MAEGRLSFSKVRAITRAPAEDEAELLEHAKTMTAAELEKLVRSWRRAGRETDEERAARIRRARKLSIFPDDDGGYVIHGKLEPEIAALVMRALEAASDALYRGSVPEIEPEQRRADALALLAERATAIGFGGEPAEPASAESPDESDAAPGEVGDAAPAAPRTRLSPAPAACSHALALLERYAVMLHVEEEALKEGEAPEAARASDRSRIGPHLDDGSRVSAETARRLSCHAGVLRIVHRKGGRLVGIHGKRRTCPHVSAARSRSATEDAASPAATACNWQAVPAGSPSPITSSIGPMGAPQS
jgi:hypothetical protein